MESARSVAFLPNLGRVNNAFVTHANFVAWPPSPGERVFCHFMEIEQLTPTGGLDIAEAMRLIDYDEASRLLSDLMVFLCERITHTTASASAELVVAVN
jgi:hypothetical protein